MTTAPLRFDPSLETISPEEAQTHAEMNETIRQIQETTAKDYGHAVRGVHAKAHGLLNGKLEILPNLPSELAQGMCAEPGTYDVVMRFSTIPGDILDDSVSTPRGLALKIIGVKGERLPNAEGATQDFVMANAPAFTAKDGAAFLKNLKMLAKTTDIPQVLKKTVSAVMRGVENTLETVGTKSPTVISLGGHPETHILGETFYSQAPIRWGDYVAKVAIKPATSDLQALTDASLDVNGKPNGLREAVSEFFTKHDGVWELQVQLRTDAETMPVEDASVIWPEDESPYVTVGRITAKPQVAWTEEKIREIDEGMAFNPWHGLQAHQPLGSIMRARRATYAKSVGFRSASNGCPIHEPRS